MSPTRHFPTIDERFWAIVAEADGSTGHRATAVPFDDPADAPPKPEFDDDGPLLPALNPQAKAAPFGEPSEEDTEESGGGDEPDADEEEESD